MQASVFCKFCTGNAAELLLCYGASLFGGKVVNNAITCSPVELSEHNVCYKVLHEAEGM